MIQVVNIGMAGKIIEIRLKCALKILEMIFAQVFVFVSKKNSAETTAQSNHKFLLNSYLLGEHSPNAKRKIMLPKHSLKKVEILEQTIHQSHWNPQVFQSN